MKRMVISLFCLVLALVAQTKAAENSATESGTASGSHLKLPGGIVYSDGKCAIYKNLATGEETNISSYMKGVTIKPNQFWVTPNCQWMAWVQGSKKGSKIGVVELPEGAPRAIQYETSSSNGVSKAPKDFLLPGEARSVRISPNGIRISVEALCQKIGWVLTDPGKPDILLRMFKNAGKSPFEVTEVDMSPKYSFLIPQYALRNESYHGIFLLSTVCNQGGSGPKSLRGSDIYEPRFGNVANMPNFPIFRANPKEIEAYLHYPAKYGTSIGVAHSDCVLGDDETKDLNRNIAKSAGFFTFAGQEIWESGKRLSYFFFQDHETGRVGPLHIQLVDSDINNLSGDNYRPGISLYALDPKQEEVVKAWEVFANLRSCEGLAVTPKGSLFILTGGNLYKIDGYDLEAGMSAARIERTNKGVKYVNNVFKANATCVGKGIIGKYMQCISEDEIIFADQNDTLCYFKVGENAPEKTYYTVPSEFCYCKNSPAENPIAAGHGKGKAGRVNARDISSFQKSAAIKTGHITTTWLGRGSLAYIYVGKIGKQKQLEFCLTEKSEFKDVGDLSGCKWRITKVAKGHESEYNGITVPLNKIVALRETGSKYCSLLKPTEFEKIQEDGLPMQMDYEWETRKVDPKQITAVAVSLKDMRNEQENMREQERIDKISAHNAKMMEILEASHVKLRSIDEVRKAELVEKDFKLFESKIDESFFIGKFGPFSWKENTVRDGGHQFNKMISVPLNSITGDIQYDLNTVDISKDVVNPLYSGFNEECHTKPFIQTQCIIDAKDGFLNIETICPDTLWFRYENLAGQYFAVTPMEFKKNSVVYRIKFWSAEIIQKTVYDNSAKLPANKSAEAKDCEPFTLFGIGPFSWMLREQDRVKKDSAVFSFPVNAATGSVEYKLSTDDTNLSDLPINLPFSATIAYKKENGEKNWCPKQLLMRGNALWIRYEKMPEQDFLVKLMEVKPDGVVYVYRKRHLPDSIASRSALTKE